MKISQAKRGAVVKLSSAGHAYVESCRRIDGFSIDDFTYAHIAGFYNQNLFDMPYIIVSVRGERGEERLSMWKPGHLEIVTDE